MDTDRGEIARKVAREIANIYGVGDTPEAYPKAFEQAVHLIENFMLDVAELALTPSPPASGSWPEGYRAGLEAAAKVAETYQRDASFDDSQVGAIEHNATQANIAAAIRALPATPSVWQPISTAPRDGTKVVLGAWIVEGPDGTAPPEWVQRVGRWVKPPGALTEDIYGWGDMGGDFRNKNHPNAGGVRYPTHWQPLPPAPPAEAVE